jgi:hypothetical protein
MSATLQRVIISTLVFPVAWLFFLGVGSAAGQFTIGTQPTSVPSDARQNSTFDAEIRAAAASPDRDGKIAHLRKALQLRPYDPQNIVIEFGIGIMVSQNPDLAHDEPVHPAEGLKIFEHIVQAYDHKAYYIEKYSGTNGTPDLMVPRSAIFVASQMCVQGKPDAARKYASVAIDDLQWTFEKRKEDWQRPLPPPATHPSSLPPDLEKQIQREMNNGRDPDQIEAARQKAWEAKKTRALAGDVFAPYELSVINAAVQVWGMSFGLRQNVADAMQPIIDRYPDTPIATVAKKNLDDPDRYLTAIYGPNMAMRKQSATINGPPAVASAITPNVGVPPVAVEPDTSVLRIYGYEGAVLLVVAVVVAIAFYLRKRRAIS